MTDESKLGKDAARGVQAENLLKSELLQEAFSLLKKNYLEKWVATTVDQVDLREKYWLAHRIVGVVQDHLNTVAADGRFAEATLERMAERQKSWPEIK